MAQKAVVSKEKPEAEEPETLKDISDSTPGTIEVKDETEGAALEAPEEASAGLKKGHSLYVLTRRYWDNRVLHPVGSQLQFPTGDAPKGSVLVR